MFHFSALVYPDSANSPRKGPWNNKQPQHGDWTDHSKRSCDCITVSPFLVPQMLYCSCPHLGHLGIHEQQGCTGSECPGALCLGRQVLTSACSHTPRKVEQGNQVIAEMGCSFAICRRVCVSLTCWVSGRCPRHWEYWKVLSYWVMKDKENFAGRWRLQSGLACTQLQLQTSVGLVLTSFCIAEMFVCTETFAKTIAEMWSCAKLCNTEMEQAGPLPFPTVACTWRRSKVGDVLVFSTVAVLWISPLCSNVQEHRTDLAGVSMS